MVTDGVTARVVNVELNPPGPVHDHAVAAVELEVRFAVPPAHIGPLLVGAAAGTGFIVTATLPCTPQQPDPVRDLKK